MANNPIKAILSPLFDINEFNIDIETIQIADFMIMLEATLLENLGMPYFNLPNLFLEFTAFIGYFLIYTFLSFGSVLIHYLLDDMNSELLGNTIKLVDLIFIFFDILNLIIFLDGPTYFLY